MATSSRTFNITNAYSHTIRWVPAVGTRLILQRIVRTTKVLNTRGGSALEGPRGNYWELWEVFGGHVYPFNLQAGTGVYIPGTHLTGEAARASLRFRVGDEPTNDQPFLTDGRVDAAREAARLRTAAGLPPAPVVPGALVGAGPAATQAHHDEARHDQFSVNHVRGRSGTFKIYAEVYELNLALCKTHRVWLNQFRPYAAGDGAHTAGALPAKFGHDTKKPLDRPTLIRYEAGEFRQISATTRTCVERDFPANGTYVRYPVAMAIPHPGQAVLANPVVLA